MRDIYRAAKSWIGDALAPLSPTYEAWMAIISGFSWLLARVFLTVAFFTIFLIYGLALRLTGRDPMNRTISDDTDTYWTDNTLKNDDLTEFKRQY